MPGVPRVPRCATILCMREPTMSNPSHAPAHLASVPDGNLPRWRQVLARDPGADGRFFYAVKSTGIYCRPTCPSRPPAPHNVTFFSTAAAAEQSGFRPCKRCRPDQTASHRQEAIVASAADYLAPHSASRICLAELALAAATNPLTMLPACQMVLGRTPS